MLFVLQSGQLLLGSKSFFFHIYRTCIKTKGTASKLTLSMFDRRQCFVKTCYSLLSCNVRVIDTVLPEISVRSEFKFYPIKSVSLRLAMRQFLINLLYPLSFSKVLSTYTLICSPKLQTQTSRFKYQTPLIRGVWVISLY